MGVYNITANGLNSTSTISATGNITGNYILGNGAFLTGVITSVSNIANGTSNVSIDTSGGNINFSIGGSASEVVFTSTGANVDGYLSVSGNANVGNIGATNGTFTSVAGTLTTAAQPNITSTGTLSSLSVTGNAIVGNLVTSGFISSPVIGNGGTSNIRIPVANGNINMSVGGLLNRLVVSTTGANVTGTIGSTGTLTAGNLVTAAGTLSVGGNANIGNIGTAGLITATGNIGGGNLSGTLVTGTLTTAAQPNITSVGTLTNVTTSGFFFKSVQTGISAAGTAQGNATALGNSINIVSTVSVGQGVRLPTSVIGMEVKILNTSANTLLVYPATNGIINALAANAAFSLGANSRLEFVATSTTQWYTMTGVYA
jgi:hypothetical protein